MPVAVGFLPGRGLQGFHRQAWIKENQTLSGAQSGTDWASGGGIENAWLQSLEALQRSPLLAFSIRATIVTPVNV